MASAKYFRSLAMRSSNNPSFARQQARCATAVCKVDSVTPGRAHGSPASTDLAREISKEIPNVKVDFMKASSYGAASESTGDVEVQGVSNLAKWDNYNILLVSLWPQAAV